MIDNANIFSNDDYVVLNIDKRSHSRLYICWRELYNVEKQKTTCGSIV